MLSHPHRLARARHVRVEAAMAAAEILVNADASLWRDPNYHGPCEAVDPAKIEELAELILATIAEVIATVLDAGSERDAVNENEALLDAIAEELRGWTAPSEGEDGS